LANLKQIFQFISRTFHKKISHQLRV